MSRLYLGVAVVLLCNAVPCIYQAVKGPTIQDTLISISIINTKTVVIMLLLAGFFGLDLFVDVSFVFAFLYFVVVYSLSRYVEAGGGRLDLDNQ